MLFSKLLFAVLPALALAQEEDGKSTTTCTSSTTITKTMSLSEVHTVTATHNNTTTSASTPTSVGTSSHFTSATVIPTSTDGGEEPPTVTEDPNAAPALDATRVVLAGVLGVAAVALM